jgi:hypothetical protein
MSDLPRHRRDDPAPSTSGSAPPPSGRQRKQIARLSSMLGEPVLATAPFWVEGTLPWYILGLVLGVGLIGVGLLGVLIGLAVGFVIARLVTGRRAKGVGFTTILAVTRSQVYALNANFWTNRSTGRQVAVWPLGEVASGIRRKRFTVAVTLDHPDGHQIRLETPRYLLASKRARTFTAHLPTPPTGSRIE